MEDCTIEKVVKENGPNKPQTTKKKEKIVTLFYVAVFSFIAPITAWLAIDNQGNIVKQSQYAWYTAIGIIVSLHIGVGLAASKYCGEVWRSYFIGSIVVAGLTMITKLSDYNCQSYGWYLCIVGMFHITEYLATALYNPATLCYDSFILNHSNAYTMAHLFCSVEYLITWYFFPVLKTYLILQYIGIFLCIFGDSIRKISMRTAGLAFTHQIQYDKRDKHELITHGVYSIWRHPSYAGWFLWSVSTQILLCNPISLCGFILVSWKFFDTRIKHEEILLLNFFGLDYYKYQKKVSSTGVPFARGYVLQDNEIYNSY